MIHTRQRPQARLRRAGRCRRQARRRPPKPTLKDPRDFKLIGKPLKRLDTPDKVNGKALYGIDMLPAGVKFATLAACPVFGGKVADVDDSAAKAIPGVRQIVVLEDLVAVIGDHMWAAKTGFERARGSPGTKAPNANVDSALVWKDIKAASEKDGAVAKSVGDAKTALTNGDAFEAHYELPFLSHAPMEPINCTVHLRADACDIWVGTQVAARTQAVAAKLTGLPLAKITVHNQLLGGGFGRRLDVDGIEKSRAHRAEGRWSDQGGVDARGRHPARFLSPGLLRPPHGDV